MMKRITSILCRIFFIGAFLLLLFAFSEKAASFFGLTMMRDYPPSRLLTFSALALLFVITLELREIKRYMHMFLEAKSSSEEIPSLNLHSEGQKELT
jgi:hypothetical protein